MDKSMETLEQALFDLKAWVHKIKEGERNEHLKQTTVIFSDDDVQLTENLITEMENRINEEKENRNPEVVPAYSRLPFGVEHDAEDSRS